MTRERLLASCDLLEGEMRGVGAGRRRALLVRVDGCVRAYEDRCPHLGVRLSDGDFEGGVITCYAHRYEFDARTGDGVNPRDLRLRAWPVTEEGGAIVVDVGEGVP